MFATLTAAADRAVLATMGQVVQYRARVGESIEITGVFDRQYVLTIGTAEAGAETTAPALFVRAADLPADPETDEPRVFIGADTYRVVERKPDGLGGMLLVLREVR